ncbi:TetR/AcrR family transcriptional regulator [Lentilactobacillus kosonis]|uniref:Transcriptional regulator, TetR family n=1 Tax=Lentilactobacillus kosonis TaxID=2810561 RepID=A0A401FI10_9LACO|nr:TetR/AcrR family transcriptional regulator [Lentilactobacillus kosonis]GAY71926.1 transcriptional regulator, TetR family [Lentilactobacillus kosonis]
MPTASEQTREYLLGALDRLLKQKNFMDITVSELTRVAGVSRMTFYRHYGNIYELLNINLKQIMAELPTYDKLTTDEYESAIANYMNFFSAHSDFIKLILRAKQQNLLRENITTVMRSLMTVKSNSLPFKERDLKYYVSYHANGFASVIIDWFSNGQVETPEEMAAFLYKNITT